MTDNISDEELVRWLDAEAALWAGAVCGRRFAKASARLSALLRERDTLKGHVHKLDYLAGSLAVDKLELETQRNELQSNIADLLRERDSAIAERDETKRAIIEVIGRGAALQEERDKDWPDASKPEKEPSNITHLEKSDNGCFLCHGQGSYEDSTYDRAGARCECRICFGTGASAKQIGPIVKHSFAPRLDTADKGEP